MNAGESSVHAVLLFSVKKKGLLILGVLKFQKQYKSSIEQQKSRPAFVPGGNGEEKSQKR